MGSALDLFVLTRMYIVTIEKLHTRPINMSVFIILHVEIAKHELHSISEFLQTEVYRAVLGWIHQFNLRLLMCMNRFEFPQPTFQKLMKEHCMEPFFVFQVRIQLSIAFLYSHALSVGWRCENT